MYKSPSAQVIFCCCIILFLLRCSLDLICNHKTCPWTMYCRIAYLGCTDCSGMCACLPALCCWRRIVWCMHVSRIDSDVHWRFESCSALSQSPWIRRYVSVTYYLDELQWLVSGNHNIAHSSIFFRMQPGQRRPPLTVTLTLVTDLKLARVPRR